MPQTVSLWATRTQYSRYWNKIISIEDKVYTVQESVQLLSRAIPTIVDENEEAVFSISDILYLLQSVNEHVPSEFEIHRTRSHYYKIVYKPEDEVIADFKERWDGFIE